MCYELKLKIFIGIQLLLKIFDSKISQIFNKKSQSMLKIYIFMYIYIKKAEDPAFSTRGWPFFKWKFH